MVPFGIPFDRKRTLGTSVQSKMDFVSSDESDTAPQMSSSFTVVYVLLRNCACQCFEALPTKVHTPSNNKKKVIVTLRSAPAQTPSPALYFLSCWALATAGPPVTAGP